jgi:hypothetical protein
MDQERSRFDDRQVTGGAEAYLPIQAFLSLYMVLLAFFILLTAMSHPEEARARQAMAGIKSAFQSDLLFGAGEDQATQHFIQLERTFIDQVGQFVDIDLKFAEVTRRNGRMIELTLPMDRIFADQATEPLDGSRSWIARLGAVLSGRPPGLRPELELLLPAVGAPGTDAMFEVRRIGALARRLAAAGVPPESMSVGVIAGRDNRVRVTFRASPPDAPRVDFRALSG